MMEEIKLFLFVLSILYTFRYTTEFVFKLVRDDESTPILLSKLEGTFLYLALAYIITYILI